MELNKTLLTTIKINEQQKKNLLEVKEWILTNIDAVESIILTNGSIEQSYLSNGIVLCIVLTENNPKTVRSSLLKWNKNHPQILLYAQKQSDIVDDEDLIGGIPI